MHTERDAANIIQQVISLNTGALTALMKKSDDEDETEQLLEGLLDVVPSVPITQEKMDIFLTTLKSIVPDKNATSVTEEGNVRYTSAGSISSSVLNANTAEFSAVLVAPGDTVNYTVTVENSGTLDAKIDTNGIVFSDLTQMNKLANNTADDAIVFSYSGIGDGTVINKNGGTNVFTISVTYNSRFTSQPEGGQLRKNLEMILNYIQA